MTTEKKKVLMVCLGNICRSPIAEAVFQSSVEKMGKTNDWVVDSAAIIGYHTGNRPDERALNVLRRRGHDYKGRARPISDNDFKTFDYIFGMDKENMSDLNEMKPESSKSKLLMLGNYGLPKHENIIEDPYY
ncbi:low molecular weight phosphotyrosine protein phosphatase 2-like isoform X2 [Condylostylus longicornis]|nr:low molecular weight phosphotyrosine protein phosphatase 2-like isoform X2 [Condylostylus longicornis]